MRRLLALALYIFIGLPAVLGSLFLVPARAWILDRDFYKSIVSGPEARAVLEAPELYARFDGTLTAEGLFRLSGPATGEALRQALPVTEVLQAAEAAVDSAFDNLDSKTAIDRFSVDLGPLKTALEGGVPAFARAYAAAAPVSPAFSASNPLILPRPGTTLDLSARPENLGQAEFRDLVRQALDSALAAVPSVAEGDLPSADPSGIFARGDRNAKDALNRSALWLSLLAGGTWLAGAFVASDSARKRLRWLGTTLVLPGVLVLSAGAVLRLAADPLVLRAVQDPELQRFLADPSLAVVRAWIRRPLWTVSTGFLVSGSLAVILGGGLSASQKALKYRDFE